MSTADMKANRPLSPHLWIYRWPLTMVMSIVHRITGGALYFGTILLAAWLLAAASGPDAFAVASSIVRSWIGLIVLFGYTWALVHHMLGGIRHFVWDTGTGLGKPTRNTLAIATLAGSISLTIVLWAIGLLVR